MEGSEKEYKTRNRLKGLFSKEKEKKAAPQADLQDVDDFLRASSDRQYYQLPTPSSVTQDGIHPSSVESSGRLNFPAPAPVPATTSHPPPLTRIDTTSARRWPTAAEVQNIGRPRGRSASTKRNKKGLAVKFTNESPVVIGEGGDEAELPTIALRQRSQAHPSERPSSQELSTETEIYKPQTSRAEAQSEVPSNKNDFLSWPLRRAATGFESIPDTRDDSSRDRPPVPQVSQEQIIPNRNIKIESHGPTSFATRAQAGMRAGEGMALLKATPSVFKDERSYLNGSPDSVGALERNVENNRPLVEKDTTTDKLKPLNVQLATLELPDYSPISFDDQIGSFGAMLGQNQLAPPRPPLHIAPLSRGSSNASQMSQTASLAPLLDRNQRAPAQIISNDVHLSRGPSNASQMSLTPSFLTPELHRTPQREAEAALSSMNNYPSPVTRSATFNLHGAAVAVGDEAMQDFSSRVSHLFNIFLLSAESSRPISQCSLDDFVRAALWWFLKGRMYLESTVRERPTSPEAQQNNFAVRQQAYADLAKSFWISETITSQFSEVSSQQRDPQLIDALETRKSILSSLRKLAMSMKRNTFLPPEEATLPQGLDTSIWIQDDGNRPLLASQKQANLPNLNDYFPLGDTNRTFHYGRAFAGAMLIEEADPQSPKYRVPVLISIIRGLNETALKAVIASQDGMLKVCVQGDRSAGTTWENVGWNAKSNVLDIRLPRGFLLRCQCNSQDFRTLQGIYDYQRKTHTSLVPQKNEEVVFETFLKTFQSFDPDPASRFSKEPLPNCRLRLFERTIVEKAASGVMRKHRGFRLGLVTSPSTKNLLGINQDLPPTIPVQFGFLRGEGRLPALLLKFSEEKSKYSIVLTFEDIAERTELHARITGISTRDGEAVIMESGIQGLSVVYLNPQGQEKDALESLEWQSIRVINEEPDDLSNPKTILSPSLRIIAEFRGGILTDRVNIEPGELRVRLSVNASTEFQVLRRPQQDMTISIAESQVSKSLPVELSTFLTTFASSDSTRTYHFPNPPSLHLFQAALTGYKILFDGLASSFNIARRRMVVPIYKKWDAATTRLQLVQRDKVIQLVAFFENFSHGECMNFALKSTDIFESSSRHSKFTLRIVDAKFALPKARGEGEMGGGEEKFVCLDMPEYPGEHDDVTIVFEDESDYERFTKALPAPVKAASRMGSVKR